MSGTNYGGMSPSLDTVQIEINCYKKDGSSYLKQTFSLLGGKEEIIQVPATTWENEYGWVEISASGPILPAGEITQYLNTSSHDYNNSISMTWYPVEP